ncbi:MAG: DUF2271 domain-containing protein [Noviherbaspirillum sp.]
MRVHPPFSRTGLTLSFTLSTLSVLAATPALAADLTLKLDIPRLNVAEYHKPYVAVWIERPDRSVAANLAVWYDLKLKNREGEKWLKDMRQWWRRSGRELEMPVDGVSGATRAPGEQQIRLTGAQSPLAKLPAGDYILMVEAAREVGGRELVQVPFQWPPKAAATAKAQGEHELGAITLELKP